MSTETTAPTTVEKSAEQLEYERDFAKARELFEAAADQLDMTQEGFGNEESQVRLAAAAAHFCVTAAVYTPDEFDHAIPEIHALSIRTELVEAKMLPAYMEEVEDRIMPEGGKLPPLFIQAVAAAIKAMRSHPPVFPLRPGFNETPEKLKEQGVSEEQIGRMWGLDPIQTRQSIDDPGSVIDDDFIAPPNQKRIDEYQAMIDRNRRELYANAKLIKRHGNSVYWPGILATIKLPGEDSARTG